MELKLYVQILLFLGMMGLLIANYYLNKAFWRSEELWLDQDDFDEEVARWSRYSEISAKFGWVCLILSVVLLIKLFFALFFQ